MPRIWTSANDALDFCKDCYPTEALAYVKYGNVGDGPDGRGNCFGYEGEHPPYEETDYRCTKCGKHLHEIDD